MIEVRFELPHLTLAGFSNGHVGKPVLLALHGWLDNAGSFELMLPYLDNYHVIAVDMPGHGLSSHRSPDAHYHFVDWVWDISVLIEQQQWRAITIVGHSMGGLIATVAAAVLPDGIARMVLIDAFGLITTQPQQACEQLRQAIRSRSALSLKRKPVHPSIESAMQARVLAGDLKEKEAAVLLTRGLEERADGFVWRSDQRLRTASAMRFSFEQATSFIANISCPVLLIEGRRGAQMIKTNKEMFQGHYADLRCKQMDGGHHCHMEYPQIAAQLVTDFIGVD
jgi:pimeloyl-ACP methyl ester carboxylesterase